MELSKFKPRGSEARRLLQDEAVLEVYQAFSDGCLRCFNMDITEHPSPYFTAVTLKQVRAFVLYYGRADAVGIVKELFGVAHEGRWRGEVVGKDIFSAKKRWMADKLLMEHQLQGVDDDGHVADGCSESLADIKARIKSLTA